MCFLFRSNLLSKKEKNGAHKHRSHCNFGERKIFTSCCLLQKEQKINKSKTQLVMFYLGTSLSLVLFLHRWYNLRVWKKKNGAHNHLSQLKNSEHQNIHVMLSYAKITQTKHTTKNTSWLNSTGSIVFGTIFERQFLSNCKEKNGAHNHLSQLKNSEHQNIHVMLSYAKRTTNKVPTHKNELLI